MLRNWLWCAVATATLLIVLTPSEARPFRRGYAGFSAGYGYGYPGGNYIGPRYSSGGDYGRYSPGYYDYGSSPRAYYGNYGWGYPQTTTQIQITPSGDYTSYYRRDPSGGDAEDPNAVLLRVRVPAGAELWFNGDRTSQTGSVREFVTPPLNPGSDYTYDIRARWNQDGRDVDVNRHVVVHAGDRINLDLVASAARSSRPTTSQPPAATEEELRTRPSTAADEEPVTPAARPALRRTDQEPVEPAPLAPVGTRSSRPVP